MAFEEFRKVRTGGKRVLGHDMISVTKWTIGFGGWEPPFKRMRVLYDSEEGLIKFVEGDENTGYVVYGAGDGNWGLAAKSFTQAGSGVKYGYYRFVGKPDDPTDLLYKFSRPRGMLRTVVKEEQ